MELSSEPWLCFPGSTILVTGHLSGISFVISVMFHFTQRDWLMLKVHEIFPKVTQLVSIILDLLESAPCLARAEDPFLTIPPSMKMSMVLPAGYLKHSASKRAKHLGAHSVSAHISS